MCPFARDGLQAKYVGEKVGVALDPLPSGPFFRDVAQPGFGGRDASAEAKVVDKAK